MTSNGAEKQKEEVLAVTVTSVEDASPNVKLVTLRVHERGRFSFRPGQWVDFYAPGVEKPGGYSIASSPGSFARDGTFALAVRASRSSACGHWVHERCRKGDEARVRVGGNGASCHVGYRSCFYRSLPTGDLPNAPVTLTFEETEKVFDPLAVYGDAPNPTQL